MMKQPSGRGSQPPGQPDGPAGHQLTQISRLSRDQWGIALAQVTARRGTCLRRQVGCVLLDAAGRVLATGYNGRASGLPHCGEPQDFGDSVNGQINRMVGASNPFPNSCPGALSPSGTNLDGCEAIHAEQNALLQCMFVSTIDTCYVTVSPCVTCTKLLLNTGCRRIVFAELYPQKEAQQFWTAAGREWINLGEAA